MVPKEIKKCGEKGIKIAWPDGRESEFPASYLRKNCECAVCRDERTGERTLNPQLIPDDLKVLKVEIFGNYAIGFLFSDGHSTGIYSFGLLRGLTERFET